MKETFNFIYMAEPTELHPQPYTGEVKLKDGTYPVREGAEIRREAGIALSRHKGDVAFESAIKSDLTRFELV